MRVPRTKQERLLEQVRRTGKSVYTRLSWLDPETADEIYGYLNNIGSSPRHVSGRLMLDIMSATDKADIQYWLNSKISHEGSPNPSVVRAIGRAGRIERPIILDSDADYTVEGRHRLAAALKYGLDVPLVIIVS